MSQHGSTSALVSRLRHYCQSAAQWGHSTCLQLRQSVKQRLFAMAGLDELIIEDIESFGLYLKRRFFQVLQLIEILYLVLSFLVVCSRPQLCDRLLYSVAILLDAWKLARMIPRLEASRIKIWLVLDLLRQFAMNLYLHHNYPVQASVVNSTTFLACCFCFKNFLYNALVAVAISIVNGTLFIGQLKPRIDPDSRNDFVVRVGSFLAYYLMSLCISHCYHLVIDEYSRRFEHARQQAQLEIRNKGMFVTSVSHDLKNPISSIQGSIDLLKASKNLGTEDMRELTTASYSCQILLYLIGNITDVTKMDAGKFDIDRIPMGINEELRKIVAIETELSSRKELKLYKLVLTPLPNSVYGDPMRFSQVLINLIGNAIKFTSHGYVGLVLRWANNVDEAKNYEYLPPDELTGEASIIPPASFFTEQLSLATEPACLHPPARLVLDKPAVERPRHKFSADPPKLEKYDMDEDQDDAVCKRMEKYGAAPELMKKCGFKLGNALSLFSIVKSCRTADNRSEQRSKRLGSLGGCEERAESRFRHVDSCYAFDHSLFARPGSVSEDGILVIDVIDTGVGMSKEEIQRLFQPFSQANHNIKKQFGGTGLGLWITKQIVALMSGLIQVQSEPKKGTRFRVLIPFKVAEERDLTPSSRSEESTEVVTISEKTPTALSDIRSGKSIRFCGAKKTLKEMRALILEDEMAEADSKLTQVVNQLKETDVQLSYGTYKNALDVLKENNYNYLSVVVITSTPTIRAKRVITRIMKTLNNLQMKQIPFAVLSDLAIQNEFLEITKGYQLTFPLSNNALVDLLLKMKMRASRKQPVAGYFKQIVEELYIKYSASEEDLFNPYNTIKVLLADDNVMCNSTLRKIMEKLGHYQVHSVFNGVDACEVYEEHLDEIKLSLCVLKVVILDIEMPERNGIEAAEWIRKLEKERQKRNVPIVGMTGHESEDVRRLCIEAGMNEVLSKPIGRHSVVDLLQRLSLK